MAQDKIYAIPNVPTPNTPVIFNPDICNGCNHCVEVCQIDVYIPNPEKGKPPIVRLFRLLKATIRIKITTLRGDDKKLLGIKI